MTGMDQFFTREKANEGAKLHLFRPDRTKTKHYLIVRGVDSDEFRAADIKGKREAIKIAALKDEKEQERRMAENRMELIVALVAGWSFEDEVTPANVKKFLKEAPQIADQIDQFAGKRALFFGGALNSSQNSQKTNSD